MALNAGELRDYPELTWVDNAIGPGPGHACCAWLGGAGPGHACCAWLGGAASDCSDDAGFAVVIRIVTVAAIVNSNELRG